MPESKNSIRRIEAVEMQRQALELRKAGATFEEIARKVGWASPQSAFNAVESALKRTLQEPADELRNLELERLDAMSVPQYARAIQGDLHALAAMLKIMERRHKLLGLDIDVKQFQGPSGGPIAVQSSLPELTVEEVKAALVGLNNKI